MGDLCTCGGLNGCMEHDSPNAERDRLRAENARLRRLTVEDTTSIYWEAEQYRKALASIAGHVGDGPCRWAKRQAQAALDAVKDEMEAESV